MLPADVTPAIYKEIHAHLSIRSCAGYRRTRLYRTNLFHAGRQWADHGSEEASQLRPVGNRQDGRPVHGLLPVRLRELEEGQPDSVRQVRWGRFNELSERNNYLLYTELKTAADAPKSALQRQYGDFFAACMNTVEVDKLGVKPLEPQLEAIAALESTKDLAAFNAKQLKRGGGGFFGVGVTQDQKDSSQQIAAQDREG